MTLWIFHGFRHENTIFGYVHYHIRNQRLKIHEYAKSYGNRNQALFKNPPIFSTIRI